MKLKSILSAAAALLTFAACLKPETPSAEASLSIDPKESVTIPATGGSATVNVTSTRDWKVVCDADWLQFSVNGTDIKGQKVPASANAVAVEISALKNEGNDREITVTFNGGTTAKASIAVKQAGELGPIEPIEDGDGSEAKPFTAAQAHAEAAKLASGATSDKAYYIRGKIHKLGKNHTEDKIKQYGNGQFYISNTGEADQNDFYCYQVNYLGNTKFTSADQVKVGDDVVVYGKITNYNGTYETVDKGAAYIYKLNGKGAPTPEDVTTEKVSEVLAAPNASKITLNNAIVVATSKKGYLVTDAQNVDFVFVYHAGVDGAVYPKVGDKVNIQAEKAEYSAMAQLTGPATTIVSSGAAVNYPAAEDITASFDSFTSETVKYISYTGKLAIDAARGYYNVIVNGATKNIGSLLSPDQVDVEKYNGVDNVTFSGYYIYTTSSKYINLILTEAKPSAGAYFSVSASNLNVDAKGAKASFDINASEGAAWKITASDPAAVTVAPASGSGTAKIEVSVADNEAFQPREFTLAVATTADVATKSYTVTIKQAAAVNPAAEYVELTNAEICASLEKLGSTSTTYTDVTFESACGSWAAKASPRKDNKWIQIRDTKSSYLKSPDFGKTIDHLEISTDANKAKIARTFYAVASDTQLVYSEDASYETVMADVLAAAYGSVTTTGFSASGTSGEIGETVTLTFGADATSFMILATAKGSTNGTGAAYINSIKIYFK